MNVSNGGLNVVGRRFDDIFLTDDEDVDDDVSATASTNVYLLRRQGRGG